MKKTSRQIILFAIIFSLIGTSVIFSNPLTASAQDEEVTFTVGAAEALVGNWDNVIWDWTFSQWCAELNTQEFLFYYLPDYTSSKDDAQSFLGLVDTLEFEYFDEEMNGAGFINKGGISSIEVDIRENVTFHDGSILNASVVKWNFDRMFVTSGNLTGQSPASLAADLMEDTYFSQVSDYANFYTAGWDHSDVVTPQYYGKDNDPDLSWTNVSDTGIAQNMFPNLNKTLVVTEGGANGGGRVRFELNAWSTGLDVINGEAIFSMEAYEDYFEIPIVGFGEAPGFIQGVDLNHLVGTGPFEYVSIDTIDTGQMILKKFDDWWNLTDMEAEGYCVIDNLVLQMYDVAGSTLEQILTTSALAGDIDFAWDQTWNPLDRDPFDANSEWTYHEDVDIATGLGALWFNMDTTNLAQRKAISYGFDYDTMINVAWEGKAVRTRGPIGQHSLYYNEDLPYIIRNLTLARQTLLDDPTYGPALTAAGLDIDSSDTQWRAFATTDDSDLFTFNYFYDDVSQRFSDVFIDSILDIGFHINDSSDWVLTGVQSTFVHYYSGLWNPQIQGCWLEFFVLKDPYLQLEAYFGVGEFWNAANVNNQTISDNLYSLKMRDEATKQELIDDFVLWVTQEAYPHFYIYQKKNGYVINEKYEIDWLTGFFAAEYVSFAPEPTDPVIPGYSLIPLFLFSLSGMALIYMFMRKKKRIS